MTASAASFATSVAPPVAAASATSWGDARQRINLAWLIRLRWAAVIGQSVTVALVSGLFNVALPLSPLLAVLMLTAGSNLLLMRRAQAPAVVSEELIGLVVTLDIVMLTALLYFTGGSTNPFNFLYLVHIALAAVTLQANWICGLVLLAFACFVLLFWWHVPLTVGPLPALPLRLHAQGMAVAFILAAAFIVYFVHRVTRSLSDREQELGRAREASARSERLSSLATLAAGAAHELSTPLATIAIVATELERHLTQLTGTAQAAAMPQRTNSSLQTLREDAQLIRQQVERCRAVLVHMAADAGASAGEPLADVEAAQLIDYALAELPARERVQPHWEQDAGRARLLLSPRGAAQAVRSVLKNALEASAKPPQQVMLRLFVQAGHLHIEVRDSGEGMSDETLTHAGEPFYTTKAPGLGMGLGLFLTRTVVEKLGGTLEVHSVATCGTTVTIRLPVQRSDAI